jgi:phosphoribosylglycinamide formyltransferase-1
LKNAVGFSVAAVIADCEAQGLQFAFEAGIPVRVVPLIESAGQSRAVGRKEQQQRIAAEISVYRPDFVVLAGFMQILQPFFIAEFRHKIINIHPSLLPELPGLNTHERVVALLKSGALQSCSHGCTVHVVDEGVDSGQIIARAKLMASANDDAAVLAARVLELEHRLYPWVLTQLSCAAIKLHPFSCTDECYERARERGFELANN